MQIAALLEDPDTTHSFVGQVLPELLSALQVEPVYDTQCALLQCLQGCLEHLQFWHQLPSDTLQALATGLNRMVPVNQASDDHSGCAALEHTEPLVQCIRWLLGSQADFPRHYCSAMLPTVLNALPAPEPHMRCHALQVPSHPPQIESTCSGTVFVGSPCPMPLPGAGGSMW